MKEPIERERLVIWTIFDHPSDFPDHFVARKFHIGKEVRATDEVVTADSLEGIRAFFRECCACLPRSPGDDPKIIESWL